jgi:muramoyltetrapeptide carboxypeptidase
MPESPCRPYPAVRPGDRVAVVAPSGPFERAAFDAGLASISSRYHVEFDPGILARRRYLAGDDARRLTELAAALADPQIKAVFCARGGYGAMRLLRELEGAPITPKAVVGFSDIVALHAALGRAGHITVHGPVLTQLGALPAATHERLFALLESPRPAEPLHGGMTFVGGIAEGPLVGGNLVTLTALLGTPYAPCFDGAVLLLEEIGERPYRLDRMWTHLALAGVFRRIRGIVLGSFTGCEERDADFTSTDVLRDLASATGLPCAAGFPIGHGELNEPVPLGVRVRLDASERSLRFLGSAAC